MRAVNGQRLGCRKPDFHPCRWRGGLTPEEPPVLFSSPEHGSDWEVERRQFDDLVRALQIRKSANNLHDGGLAGARIVFDLIV